MRHTLHTHAAHAYMGGQHTTHTRYTHTRRTHTWEDSHHTYTGNSPQVPRCREGAPLCWSSSGTQTIENDYCRNVRQNTNSCTEVIKPPKPAPSRIIPVKIQTCDNMTITFLKLKSISKSKPTRMKVYEIQMQVACNNKVICAQPFQQHCRCRIPFRCCNLNYKCKLRKDT